MAGRAPNRGVPFRQLHGAGGQFTKRNQGILWTGLEAMANNINKRGNTLNSARKKAIDKLADDMEKFAKRTAPWRDDTGEARDRLVGTAVHNDKKQLSTAYLGHGVGYGIYLETIQGGKFAVIMPTIEHFSRTMMSTVKEFDTPGQVFERMYG